MTDNTEMAMSGGSVLQATLNNGINCNVRVILNNTNVSPPPPSDVDDMMEEDVVGGGDGKFVLLLYLFYIHVLFVVVTASCMPPALPYFLMISHSNKINNKYLSAFSATTDINTNVQDKESMPSTQPEDSTSDEGRGGASTPPPSEDNGAFSRENSDGLNVQTSSSTAAGGGADGGGGEGSALELLLGIADDATNAASGFTLPPTPNIEKERRELLDPTTLPTSMTNFLDMLSEEQRRVRHRYIPGVEGFRKLYKGEVRSDMIEARRMAKKKMPLKEDIEEEEDAAAMEGVTKSEVGGDDVPPEEEEEEDDGMPDREAFIAPTKESRKMALSGQLASLLDNTDFEESIKGSNTPSKKNKPLLKSPQLVDTLTSFNPPRPQESTTYKTHHRLKRWEENPNEVESDLSNYRKTVTRTREELDIAKNEHSRIESVSSLMRNHFMNHLISYRKEMQAINDSMGGVTGSCGKLDDEYNGLRSLVRTRGVNVRSMKDIIGTLKMLGEEIEGVKADDDDDDVLKNDDWRVMGVGGVSTKMTKMANGWLLVGDEVIVSSTGEEGVVTSVTGPQLENAEEAKKGDAMDVDLPNKNEAAAKSSTKKVLKPTTISVKLTKSGKVQTYSPAEVEFNPKSLPTLLLSDPKLAKRWEDMVSTALATGVDHDTLAMEEYISSSLAKDKTSEDKKGDGKTSPKSVLPFGSGLVAAPDDVKNYPSVIPMDNLEETVRKVVYEADKPRIMVTMSDNLRQAEARQEEMNVLKGKVLQLRNKLGRQKRLRSLNERSLIAGKNKANKVEGLLLEMQMDLKNLKTRLHKEVTDLGIGNGIMLSEGAKENEATADPSAQGGGEAGEASGINDSEQPDAKRARINV